MPYKAEILKLIVVCSSEMNVMATPAPGINKRPTRYFFIPLMHWLGGFVIVSFAEASLAEFSGYSPSSASSARIRIQLIIPASIKPLATIQSPAQPISDIAYHQPNLPETRLCFQQKGIPDYQLLMDSRSTAASLPPQEFPFPTRGEDRCYEPFKYHTTDQLLRLTSLQKDQITLTVAPE